MVYGGYSAFAKHLGDPFEDSWFFWTAKIRYHHEMNEYFNEKFEKVLEVMNKNDFFKPNSKNRLLLTPPSEENINECELRSKDSNDEYFDNKLLCNLKENCKEENLSTYCVSLGALDLYMRYSDKLDYLQASIPKTNDVSF